MHFYRPGAILSLYNLTVLCTDGYVDKPQGKQGLREADRLGSICGTANAAFLSGSLLLVLFPLTEFTEIRTTERPYFNV